VIHHDPTGEASHHPPPQNLAAFVDGSLDVAAREAMLGHLAACDYCSELVSEVVRFQTEEGGGSSTGSVGDDASATSAAGKTHLWRRHRWRRGLVPVGLLAAASLLVWFASPRLGWWTAGWAPLDGLLAEIPAAAFSEAWLSSQIEGHGWPETLGSGTLGGVEQTSFRMGVRAVELDVALRAGDAAAALRLTHLIERLTSNLEGGEFLAPLYAEPTGIRAELRKGALGETILHRHHQVDELLLEPAASGGTFIDPFWYAFGKWAQAARLAALTDSGAHFRSAAHRRFLTRLRGIDLPPDLQEPWEEIDQLLRGDDPSNPAVAAALAELIRRAGGGSSEMTVEQ
jgi:hypothetical protein